jgi:hypothetical protein
MLAWFFSGKQQQLPNQISIHLKDVTAHHAHVLKPTALASKIRAVIMHIDSKPGLVPIFHCIWVYVRGDIFSLRFNLLYLVRTGNKQNPAEHLEHCPCVHLAGMPLDGQIGFYDSATL